MRNDFDYVPKKNDDEYVDHFLHGLHNEFWHPDYKNIKQKLWALTKAVVSYGWEDDVDHSITIALLKRLIAGAWRCKDYMEREKYTHPSFNRKWVGNPFYQRIKDQDKDFLERNKPYLMHEGRIEHLSIEEIRNFTLAIDSFFEKLNVLDWFKLLDRWEEYSKKADSIASYGWDEHPLCTYEELLRLIEITFLADSFYYNHIVEEGLPHNGHLFEDDYVITKLDATNTDVYNPLEHVNWIFADYTADELKEEIDYWFDCANSRTKIWSKAEPGKLVDFHDRVICLYEAGWVLVQGEEIPTDWLDPTCFESFEKPKEAITNIHCGYSLSSKERGNPAKTLSKLYRRTGVDLLRNHLSEILSYALRTDRVPHNPYDEDRKKIKQIIEVLNVINQQVCVRRDEVE